VRGWVSALTKEIININIENKYKIWFEIEAHATDALADLGVVPKEAAKAIWARGKFEVDRINEIEKTTKHDVIAFLTNVAEHVGPEARFLHQGMTSSDVLDTCLAVQLKQASDILEKDLDDVLAALKKNAHWNSNTRPRLAAAMAFMQNQPRSA
jgi:adenylosuccinate lyase